MQRFPILVRKMRILKQDYAYTILILHTNFTVDQLLQQKSAQLKQQCTSNNNLISDRILYKKDNRVCRRVP
jgi:hypothetical protein